MLAWIKAYMLVKIPWDKSSQMKMPEECLFNQLINMLMRELCKPHKLSIQFILLLHKMELKEITNMLQWAMMALMLNCLLPLTINNQTSKVLPTHSNSAIQAIKTKLRLFNMAKAILLEMPRFTILVLETPTLSKITQSLFKPITTMLINIDREELENS